ncbi:MAG TPA: DUF547 domain-containing protein [Thiotrichaceae bacterium]|nr:DUF547 domain-containing protein [Thiotrichaceae bacterium]HIL39567.1 DUF547 domain-containing protein [Methylococcales bacterium]
MGGEIPSVVAIMNSLLKSAFLGSLLLLSACTTISPVLNKVEKLQLDNFPHQQFDQVLNQAVDEKGLVDYKTLKLQAEDIDAYYQLISQYSPDSHPELFSSEQHRLTYWINAYNAAVIKTVLNYYPIKGIEEVKPPFPFFFLPDKMGFFVFQKPIFGKVSTSLYYLENKVIRERFSEPRIHFALNCASRGCPSLPDYAFTGAKLEQQLEQEARRFFSEPRNFRIDCETETIYMSSIMDWYEDDFIDWYQLHYPEKKATLINFIRLYLSEETASLIEEHASAYKIEFIPYDWNLNDQNPIH